MLVVVASTVGHVLLSAPMKVGRPLPRCGLLRMMSSEADGSALVRLDKLLADRGAGSRKDVDRLIRKGMVEIETETGEYETVGKSGGKLKVRWDSCPIVDGFDYPPPPLLAAYHKPLGVVSTMKDNKGRPDLSAVLPQSWQKSLHPVGRLDADTTGLLLFCRDGELTHRLLHPKYVVEREYFATVENPVDEALLRTRLAEGVEMVEEGSPLIVQGDLLSVEGQVVRAIFREGKYRMVRRVLAACGHPVVELHRERYGEVRLSELGIEEGESAAIEELEWLETLKAVSRAEGEETPTDEEGDAAGDAAGQSKPPPPPPPLPPPPPPPPRPPRDLEKEMAEAAKREWQPPEKLVQLLEEEADVTREEAVEALRRHEGDVVKALQELL